MIGASYARRMMVRRLTVVMAVVASCLVAVASAVAEPSSHAFEIVPGSFAVSTGTGQAAAHSDLTVAFDFAHEGTVGPTFNDGRTTIVELPPGFIGNNTAVPTCTFSQLVGDNGVGQRGNVECLPASQIGTISFDAHLVVTLPKKSCFPCTTWKSRALVSPPSWASTSRGPWSRP